jgi:hypothetical protein
MDKYSFHKMSGHKKRSTKNEHKDMEKIRALRDKLQAAAKTEEAKEKIGMACKGMYGCVKGNPGDDGKQVTCLDTIYKKLEKLAKGSKSLGGGKKKRSKSKARSKSRSKSRKRSHSRR